MRFRRPLDEILGRKSKVTLLRFMILTGIQGTGRRLAKEVGLDHKTCIDALIDLEASKLVRSRRVGRASFYSLNEGFPILKEVLIPLFNWERDLPERFARDLRQEFGPDALSIFLFGSTAKQTDEARSDIDLLIVGRDRAGLKVLDQKQDEAHTNLLKKYGRVPMWIFMDVKKFRRKFMNGDTFLHEILRTGRRLHGLRVEALLKLGRPKDRQPRGAARGLPGAVAKSP